MIIEFYNWQTVMGSSADQSMQVCRYAPVLTSPKEDQNASKFLSKPLHYVKIPRRTIHFLQWRSQKGSKETILLLPTASFQGKSLPRDPGSAFQVLSQSPPRNITLLGRPRQGCAPRVAQQSPRFCQAPQQEVLCHISHLPRCTVGINLPARPAQCLSHLVSFESVSTQWHVSSWENKRHQTLLNVFSRGWSLSMLVGHRNIWLLGSMYLCHGLLSVPHPQMFLPRARAHRALALFPCTF